MQKVHYVLGYSGLIPFVGLSVLTISGYQEAEFLLLTYAALILSFLAGIVWMTTITSHQHWSIAAFSNLLMLLAWLSVFLGNHAWSLIVIGLSMLLLLWIEHRYLQRHYTEAFYKLRRSLTLAASISLFSAAIFS